MINQVLITGFADEICADLNKQIEVIKALGIVHIEMRGVNGRPLVDHSLDKVWQIKTLLDQNQIKLSAVGSPIGKIMITDSFEPHFELFKKTVAIAKILNTHNIRMFSFFIPEGENPDEYQAEVFARIEKLVDYARDQDVLLLHENEKDIYGDDAKRCKTLMDRFSCGHFQAIFDFANFVQVGQDTLEAYKLLKPWIRYIHIKDALTETKAVVPAGEGDGHVEEILRELFESGFGGFLSLEPHLATFDGFGRLEKGGGADKDALTGPEAYALAYRALKKILARLGVSVKPL